MDTGSVASEAGPRTGRPSSPNHGHVLCQGLWQNTDWQAGHFDRGPAVDIHNKGGAAHLPTT